MRRLRDALRLRSALPQQRHPLPRLLRPGAGVADQGAKLLSAVGSIIDSKEAEEIDEILLTLPDFTSFANRYSVAASPLQRSHRR